MKKVALSATSATTNQHKVALKFLSFFINLGLFSATSATFYLIDIYLYIKGTVTSARVRAFIGLIGVYKETDALVALVALP